MKNKKPYCTAPWNALTIGENGNVKTCCSGRTILGNINSESIADIVKNNPILDVKNKLLSNQYTSNCTACYEQEELSGVSLRGLYNLNYPKLSGELQFLDVRWNNLCNLACIYCNEEFSNVWAIQLGKTAKSQVKNTNTEVLEWILSKVSELKEVMLVGGEPLLMKQNYELLKQLPANVKVCMITNLAYDVKKNPATDILLLRPKQHIMWNVSTENIKSQFEYVRNRNNWEQFEKNLIFLKEKNFFINLNMVYGVFSAFTLLETVQYYHALGITQMCLQPLGDNPSLNVFNFPVPVLEKAYEALENTIKWIDDNVENKDKMLTHADAMLSKLQEAIDNNEPSVTKDDFLRAIRHCNKWNKNKFENLWPNEYQLILSALS